MKKRFAKYAVLSLIAVVFAVAVFMTAATSVNRVIEEAVDFSQILPDAPEITIDTDGMPDEIVVQAASKSASGSYNVSAYNSATVTANKASEISESKDSFTNWYQAVAEATTTLTINFTGDLATAISNGRLKLDSMTVNSKYIARAYSQKGQATSSQVTLNVSGGLSGSFTILNTSANRDNQGTYSAANTVRNQTVSSTSVTIRLRTYCSAVIDHNSIFSRRWAYARARAEINTIVFKFSTNKPTVTFSSSDTNKGTVSPSGNQTPDFYQTASSTAEPKDGYYFTGWTGGNKNLTQTTAKAFQFKGNLSYTASFAAINFPVGTYVYNGKQQAPAVTGLPGGYSATYSYQGTRFNGVAYAASSTKPTDAGNYTATATIKNASGVAVGTKTVSFTIERADLTATLQGTALYGQVLSQAAFDPAGNVVIRHASDASLGLSYINGAGLQGGTVATYNIEWTDGSIRLPYGTSKQTFRVVLNDVQSSGTWYYYANNYNNNLVMTGGATIATANGLTLSKLEGDETDHPQNLVAFDYDASYTFVKDNIAYIGLRATPDEAGAFYFAGWRTGNAYFTLQKVYSYPLPADYQEEAIDFQGVFIGVTTEDVRRPYDGSSVFVLPAFTYSRPSTFKIVYDDPVYSSGTYPVAIGAYTASIAIYNNSDGNRTLIATHIVDIAIEVADILLVMTPDDESFYNAAIGWGEKIAFNISVQNAAPGSIAKYLYSTDGGATWHDAMNRDGSTAPSASLGCPLSFLAPTEPDVSRTTHYLFVAVPADSAHGVSDPATGEHVVARLSEPFSCKIDTVAPSIDNITYDGAEMTWYNRNITVTFTLTFGGSGAAIEYSLNGSSEWISAAVSMAPQGMPTVPGLDFNPTDDETITNQGTFTLVLSAEQNNVYRFRLRNGTGREAVFDVAFDVKIDKTAPSLTRQSITGAQRNGWYYNGATLTMKALEATGWSGIDRVECDLGGEVVKSGSATLFNADFTYLLTDNRIYRFTVYDKAGNCSTFENDDPDKRPLEVRANVDIVVPTVSVSSDYTPGVWVNADEIVILLTVTTGASGVRPLVSNDGTSFRQLIEDGSVYLNVDNADEYYKTNITGTVTYEVRLTAEQAQNYVFRAVSKGELTGDVTAFGDVKIDRTAPRISDQIDLTPYQTEWRKETLLAWLTAEDTLGIVNSGGLTVNAVNGEDVVAVSYEGGRYQFSMTKCTDYVVTVTDAAGNAISVVFRANIDQVEPELAYEAFIGSTDKAYVADDDPATATWISRQVYGDDAYLRIDTELTFSPSGVKLQYMIGTGGTWRDFPFCESGFVFEEGNENGDIQHRSEVIEIRAEQNDILQIRLLTGSGVVRGPIDFGVVRIDSTTPATPSVIFRDAENGTAYPSIRTKWVNRATIASFVATDGPTGSGIQTVAVKKYFDASLSGDGEDVALTSLDNVNYSFAAADDAYYVITMSDVAGNIATYSAVRPLIDTTDGFSLSLTTDYVSGTWLNDDSEQALIDFSIVFDGRYTGFGASGGRVEFSTDGINWVTESDILDVVTGGNIHQAIVGNDTLNPSLILSASQANRYRFRAVTGAGTVAMYDGEILFCKDTVTPEVSVGAEAADLPYDGTFWTASDVLLNVLMNVGAAGAVLEYVIADTADADLSDAQWTKLGDVGEGRGIERVETVSETTNGKYFFYRLVGNNGKASTIASSVAIKIDKTEVSASFEAVASGAPYTGAWTDQAVTLTLNEIVSGPSGYTVLVAESEPASGVWSDYVEAGGDSYLIDTDIQKEFKLKLVSGSGIEWESDVQLVRIDRVIPQFTASHDSESYYDASTGWYVKQGDIVYTYFLSLTGTSGAVAQYRVSDNGSDWGEWIDAGLEGDRYSFAVHDETCIDGNGGGGIERYYQLSVLSGSGVRSAIDDLGIIRLDSGRYKVSTVAKVGEVAGEGFAFVSGAGNYLRGETVDFAVSTAAPYFFRSLSVTSDAFEEPVGTEAENTSTTEATLSVVVEGANIICEVQLYRSIYLRYDNLSEALQAGATGPAITITDEDAFDLFGEIVLNVGFSEATFGYAYSDIESLLGDKALGVFDLVVTPAIDNFLIANGTGQQYKLVYFKDYSDNDSAIFHVNSAEDLAYVELYVNPDGRYDFLSTARMQARFYQTADIEVTADFRPLCTEYPFTATYDGQGYRIFAEETITVSSEKFGLFANLQGLITNLGVSWDLEIASDHAVVGYHAAVLTGDTTGITGSYALGAVRISDAEDVVFGGIVGRIATEIGGVSSCYSYVDIDVSAASSGKIGGMVGEASTLVLIGGYSVGVVVSEGTRASVGSVAGSVTDLVTSVGDGADTITGTFHYNRNAVFVNATAMPDRLFGDAESIVIPDSFVGQDFAFFMESEEIVGEEASLQKVNTVAELTASRLGSWGLAGSGTAEDPFLIDHVDKLVALEWLPWAYFRQTLNLSVSGAFNPLGQRVPFAGVYDGDGYSISNLTVTDGSVAAFIVQLKGTIRNLVLLNIDFVLGGAEVYAGAAAAFLYEGASIENVVASGTIVMTEGSGSGYLGGIVAAQKGGSVNLAVSMVSIAVEGAREALVGGVIARAESASSVRDVLSVSVITASYAKGFVGGAIGYVDGSAVTGRGIYDVVGNVYVNGSLLNKTIGQNDSAGNLTDIATKQYSEVIGYGGEVGMELGGRRVSEILDGFYPFRDGDGSDFDPFVIYTYTDLLKVGSYMFASFKLGNDIVIGDFDGDGELTEADNYRYDFQSLGGNAEFKGTFDGDGKSIMGLTEALFHLNGGDVRNLNLIVDYRIYSDESQIPAGVNTAKIAKPDADLVFGTVANYNRVGGQVNSVKVQGVIDVNTVGRSRVKIGGVIGVAEGGQIFGAITSIQINVTAATAEVGGVIGSIVGRTETENSFMLNAITEMNVVVDTIRVYGATAYAGLVAGTNKSGYDLIREEYETSAKVEINGENLGSVSVGYATPFVAENLIQKP